MDGEVRHKIVERGNNGKGDRYIILSPLENLRALLIEKTQRYEFTFINGVWNCNHNGCTFEIGSELLDGNDKLLINTVLREVRNANLRRLLD